MQHVRPVHDLALRNTTTPTKMIGRNYNILFHNGRNRLELIDWCPLVVKKTKYLKSQSKASPGTSQAGNFCRVY